MTADPTCKFSYRNEKHSPTEKYAGKIPYTSDHSPNQILGSVDVIAKCGANALTVSREQTTLAMIFKNRTGRHACRACFGGDKS